MTNFVEVLFIFVIFCVASFSLIGSISTIHSINIGDCAPDVNGTLVNCSLSDSDYNLLNKTETAYTQTFAMSTPLIWVLVAGVFIGGLMLLNSLRRN